MSPLKIQNNNSNDFTLVSNRFLDLYMPETNGEFVKIYLHLLRSSVGQVSPPTLPSIADTFNCTEKDVERALNYWCKKNVLDLTFDDKKHITQITFLDLNIEQSQAVSVITTVTPAKIEDITTKIESSNTKIKDGNTKIEDSNTKVEDSSTTPLKKSSLSLPRIKELKKNEDIVQLLFIAEQYLGKTLSPTEVSRLLYFYEDLHFSPDLIEYLIEYCVSKNSKSIRYIEKVALAWHETGITTVTAAKQTSNTYNKNYFAILKALGISNRNPIDSEIQTMEHWLKDFGFTLEIITTACNRTIESTGKSSFPYTDGILTSWHKEQVLTLADVDKLDKAHKMAKVTNSKAPTKARSSNKFNNFSQRNYNFDDLEKQLLKKQLIKSRAKE